MTKVSIGFRGWRFDEDEVFDEDGSYRPLPEMDEDTRERIQRIPELSNQPCDVCYLAAQAGERESRDEPTAVYGEPGAEVLVCDAHEATFYYWFLDAGGDEHEGTPELQDAFHKWVAAGNREPEHYEGPDHVETDPDSIPAPAAGDLQGLPVELPESERARIDLLEGHDHDDIEGDLDLDLDYPTGDE
jgi:hypothetical protein